MHTVSTHCDLVDEELGLAVFFGDERLEVRQEVVQKRLELLHFGIGLVLGGCQVLLFSFAFPFFLQFLAGSREFRQSIVLLLEGVDQRVLLTLDGGEVVLVRDIHG